MIPVTKTFLPPKKEYEEIITSIWDSNQIANSGALHTKLIKGLEEYLQVENIILTANGTLPLQIALKSLANGGEVITSPFSYVASVSSIVWEKCTPRFVDIDSNYLTIDESKIEKSITDKTTAILATHVFGNPCNVDVIQKIANNYGLHVIYDAAHAFNVKYKGGSLFNYGDVSTCSFHATKIFHTGEGGAIFCKDKTLYDELFFRHNFGHNGPLNFYGLGINAKMSELQAGMGLAVLPYLNNNIQKRRKLVDFYNTALNFKNFRTIIIREETDWNYSYYPVIFKNESILLNVQEALEKVDIYPRRYFYTSLNTLNYVEYSKMKNSEAISNSILCLPLYAELDENQVMRISDIVNKIN